MIKITKMPFEKHSYVLSMDAKTTGAYVNPKWADMAGWMNEQGINYRIDGNILTFRNENEESFFLMRYYNGQAENI